MTPGTQNHTKIWRFKFQKNQKLQFSPIFITPDTWNLAKIRLYNFLQFSWPRVHETLQKSDFTIFSNFHDPGYMKPCKNWMLQFFPNFHDPGYTKPCKNRTLPFSLIFMTLDIWNLEKIRCFNFFIIFITLVHETLQKSDSSIFSNFHDPGYMKPWKNRMLQFFSNFHDPRYIETLQKSDYSIFTNFYDPGYMKPCKNRMLQFSLIFMNPDMKSCKNRMLQFSLIFMNPGTWNLAKTGCRLLLKKWWKVTKSDKTWKKPWNRAKSKKRRALSLLERKKLE